MDIVLGVSTTPTTVRMVLVEGEKADGITLDNDVCDIAAIDGVPTSSPSEQVSAAVLGAQQRALATGHQVVAVGLTWSGYVRPAVLRESLAARGIEDAVMFSELQVAGALAQAAGEALGYEKTALIFVEQETATVSVVGTADGSMATVLSRSLHDSTAVAVLPDLVASLETQKSQPQGVFVVGSGLDISSVKSDLEALSSLTVSAPEDPELALARGAALAAANAARFEASTQGLAYSLDPDGIAYLPAVHGASAGVTGPLRLPDVPTLSAPAAKTGADDDEPAAASDTAEQGRRAYLPLGSSLAAVCVLGVVVLILFVAVRIQPTTAQRSTPAPRAMVPVTGAPVAPAPATAPATAPAAAPAVVPPVPDAAPVQDTPQQPATTAVAVVQEAAQVPLVQAPPVKAQAPAAAPQKEAPAPEAAPIDPPPAVEPVLPVAAPPLAAPALPAPPPVAAPPLAAPALPAPPIVRPPITMAPIMPPPVQNPSPALAPWAPSVWLQTPLSQIPLLAPPQLPPRQPPLLPPALLPPRQPPPLLPPQVPLWPRREPPPQVPQWSQMPPSPPQVPQWSQMPPSPPQVPQWAEMPSSPPPPERPPVRELPPPAQLPLPQQSRGPGWGDSRGSRTPWWPGN
jgi:hypothetical protein